MPGRLFRAGLAVLLTLTCRGDFGLGLPTEADFIAAFREIIVNAPSSSRIRTEASVWLILWTELGKDIRPWMLHEPEPRLRQALDRVMARADNLDLDLRRPLMWQSPAWAEALASPYTLLGHTDKDGRTITINGYYASLMSDDDLEILIAHELGHCYDIQTHRRLNTHLPLNASLLTEQNFADAMAGALYGQDKVASFNKRNHIIQ